jgi:hypothetical protein
MFELNIIISFREKKYLHGNLITNNIFLELINVLIMFICRDISYIIIPLWASMFDNLIDLQMAKKAFINVW